MNILSRYLVLYDEDELDLWLYTLVLESGPKFTRQEISRDTLVSKLEFLNKIQLYGLHYIFGTIVGTFPVVERKILQLLQWRLRNSSAQEMVEFWPTGPELFCFCRWWVKFARISRNFNLCRTSNDASVFRPIYACRIELNILINC